MSWKGCSHTSGTQTPIRSSTNLYAIPPSATWGRGASALFAAPVQTCNVGPGGGGPPPSRGGVAAFGPAGSALWGGPQPPPACPVRHSRAGHLAVGGRSAQSAALFRGQGVPPLRGPASSAGRPRRCAALSPVCCPLAPVSPPRAAGPPPLALGGAPPLGWGR